MHGLRPKKRILVLSATAGAGHYRAAEALERTAREADLGLEIRHFDILDFTSPLFKKLYGDVYLKIIGTSPDLWGYLYRKSEFKGTAGPKSLLLKLFDHFNYKKYFDALDTLKPDGLVCTHFLPYMALASARRIRFSGLPVFSVPTDYDVHSLWVHPIVRRYYVATEEAAWTLRSHGIDPRTVRVTGIPVRPEFSHPRSRALARRELSLPPEAFTLLVLSGGYGVGIVDQIISSLLRFLMRFRERRFQILVVCGRNHQLFRKLERLRPSGNVSIRSFPFVDFIHTLMDSSDILITKPGGLTVSEALAKCLPMIVFDPFPGQEGRNADYVTEKGAALRAINIMNLQFKLDALIRSPALLKEMKGNIRAIAKPDAALRILEDVSDVLGSPAGRKRNRA